MAALMILLFLGSVRSTIIVLVSLPLAVICALIGLFVAGETVNSMTLGGLALSVGLLIDQSIVVIENIERHLAMGKSPLRAALDGGREVAKAVFVITITTVTVFFPVLFLTGMGKMLFSSLALAVVFALAGSYVIAMTVVPAVAARLLRRHSPDVRSVGAAAAPSRRLAVFQVFEAGFERLRQAYVEVLAGALRRRRLVLVSAGALFGGSLLLYPALGQELFPPIDSGQVTIRVRAPSGLRVERTEEIVAKVEAIVAEVVPEKERVKVISNIGVLLDWPAAYTPNSGPMDAFVSVQFSQQRARSAQEYAQDLRARLNERLPGNEFAVDAGGLVTAALTFGLPSPINIQIEGKDLAQGTELAEQVRAPGRGRLRGRGSAAARAGRRLAGCRREAEGGGAGEGRRLPPPHSPQQRRIAQVYEPAHPRNEPVSAPARAQPGQWYAWGDKAFARARREKKPVLLSVGYSTCHWSASLSRTRRSPAPSTPTGDRLDGSGSLYEGRPPQATKRRVTGRADGRLLSSCPETREPTTMPGATTSSNSPGSGRSSSHPDRGQVEDDRQRSIEFAGNGFGAARGMDPQAR